jgi:zinc transport system substrate-binding protein
MSRNLANFTLVAALSASPALADAPNVAVDIAPLHSLVARVMQGVGTPDLIIQSGASPHEYNLRPSEAKALQDANLVFWIGPGLTPWLTETIETIAPNAQATEMLETDGTIELEFREGALFEAHADHDDHEGEEHDDDEHHEDEEHHDDDEHHEDEEHHDDDEHHEEKTGHEGHNHGSHDPHAWLSPLNAATWLNTIAGKLSASDPANAGAYFANATAGRAEIETLIAQVNTTLAPVRGGNFVVFHDAYQYFETAFDFPAGGAISISDASDPSPARIAEIQEFVEHQKVDCVLAEPQFNPRLVETVLNGTDAKTGILDPLGADLELGPNLYPALISNLASSLAKCM